MGASARFEQGQAIILLDQVVQFASHILVESLEQKYVQLVENEGMHKRSVKTMRRERRRNDRGQENGSFLTWIFEKLLSRLRPQEDDHAGALLWRFSAVLAHFRVNPNIQR